MKARSSERPGVDLYWLPLGAGGHSVRLNGRIFEAVIARLEKRSTKALYHSALVVRAAEGEFVIEQAPVRDGNGDLRGVVAQGAVGSRWASWLRIFRYEIRCWRDGVIPDVDDAVDSPQRLSDDPFLAQRVLELVPALPTPVWGRDELQAGEMWNSNSVISWLIARSGLGVDAVHPPAGGRAPGWRAGLVVARRHETARDPIRRELLPRTRVANFTSRSRRPHRRAVWLVAGLLSVAAAAAVLVDRALVSEGTQAARPDLQQIIDGLVTGRGRVAPGVTAYVSGPHGTWWGSAGLANVRTAEPMRPDARMHLDSNSKAWTATVILQLVGEGKLRLDDTLERWLPGLMPYGDRITVGQLLNHTSGLIDDESDITPDPMRSIRRVRDPVLRAELLRLWRQAQANPAIQAPTMLWARFAAALPLRSVPGTTYHYSNLGYTIAGLLAAKVSGVPLEGLYRQRIIEPLALASAAYQPQGEISGPHPRDYSVRANGVLVDATGWYRAGNGAGSGIVADAADAAHFLTALMQGKLLRPAELEAMETPSAASGSYALGIAVRGSGCVGTVYQHNGSSYATTSSVFVSADGKRVAVLLLNGNTLKGGGTIGTTDPRAGAAAVVAANRLYCAT